MIAAPPALAPALLDAVALIGRVASVGVGLVFFAAALAKLRHRALLPGVIANYRILPPGLVGPAARVLPPAELALGIWLLDGWLVNVAAMLAIMLLLVFAGAMAINLRRGRSHIDCGCGHGALRQTLAWPLVARNLMLSAMLVPALAALPLPPGGTVLGLAGGLVLFLVFHLFHAIGALAGSPPAMSRKGSVR